MSGRFWIGIYLIFIVWPVPGFLEGNPEPLEALLVAIGLAVFAGLYLR